MSDAPARRTEPPPVGTPPTEPPQDEPLPAELPHAERPPAEELLEVAVEAARCAGALLAARVRHGAEREVRAKSTPTDLVSEADLASELAIRELLAVRRPHDGFVGEEGDHIEGTSGLSWVVDPLDGTVNFLFGLPQWCVSVAVRDARGTILAGAIYDPGREQLFSVLRGSRATLAGPEGTIELGDAHALRPRASDLASAMVATGFAYDARVRAAQALVLARVLPRVRDIRRFGSAALDLAWMAAGRYDAYFERTVKPWDIAAGTLLCEAAGLQVVELPAHEDLPWGILVAPPALCAPLLELVG
ncbi:MAG TPA: inositol monophosphatase family protein [Solirubrobacteraceae bacterium]|nr:inositol monophosphatase family protein [Solirubrobacteraceae bacterium]